MSQLIVRTRKSFRFPCVICLLALCVVASGTIAPSQAAVVGVFDSSRAGLASIDGGLFATEARASLLANFPGSSIVSTPTLTPAFLAGVDTILITSASSDDDGAIEPLSAAEQSAVFNFVKAGGTAMLLADTFNAAIASQSMVAPFGMTVVDDGLSGLQWGTIEEPSHPIFDGPFGVQSLIAVLGAGMFTNLGPYAQSLSTMDSTGLPIIAAIEADAIVPGSGRVLFITDATPFADEIVDGYFSQAEVLFLNSIEYLTADHLVPEPATQVIAALGLGLWSLTCGIRRRKQG